MGKPEDPDTDPIVALTDEVKLAELKAKKAKADGEAVVAEAAARKAVADADAAEAAAAKSVADARKAQAESDEYASPDASRARVAQHAQDAAEADQAAFAARAAQVKALIPDLDAVKGGKLASDTTGPAPGSATLTFGGMDDAAQAIAVKLGVDAKMRILVTSDPDLASQDGIRLDVTSGLDGLHGQAAALVKGLEVALKADAGKQAEAQDSSTPRRFAAAGAGGSAAAAVAGFAAAGPVAAALASAVPGVLSLLSADRSLSSKATSVSDLAAAAAVAGALLTLGTDPKSQRVKPAAVVHDTFRLVPEGSTKAKADRLVADRLDLSAGRLTLTDRKAAIERDLDLRKGALKDLEDESDKLARPLKPDLQQQLDLARSRVARLHERLARLAVVAGELDALVALIDAFSAAIRTVPAGARRTPLATAALYDQIHGGKDAFTHMLLVVAQQGSSTLLTNDKPMFFADTFSTFVEVAISYVLIATPGSEIVAAGTETTVITAQGKIGDSIIMKVDGRREEGRIVPGMAWSGTQMEGKLTEDS